MKKKILNFVLSFLFIFSIIASAVMIFPQNAKSEGEPGNSLNWNSTDFADQFRKCSNGIEVIFCVWCVEDECWPEWQDLCPED